MPGWALNSAVDVLLKNEFDQYRERQQAHPLMQQYGISAVPFSHPDLALWRDDNHKKLGACILHKPTNLTICGIVDDIWKNQKTGELHIVDYKSTSTDYAISLDSEYKQGYKRQMEMYQWIFRKLGFAVSSTGYFVFANATKKRPDFNARLEFEMSIIPYEGSDTWVEPAIVAIKKCLDSGQAPESSPTCQYCNYRNMVNGEGMKKQTMFI
jgi:hypothetical protein